eukprot:COSAG02_NODE_6581_length_3479_cov_18.301479_4_plen_152_part_00
MNQAIRSQWRRQGGKRSHATHNRLQAQDSLLPPLFPNSHDATVPCATTCLYVPPLEGFWFTCLAQRTLVLMPHKEDFWFTCLTKRTLVLHASQGDAFWSSMNGVLTSHHFGCVAAPSAPAATSAASAVTPAAAPSSPRPPVSAILSRCEQG